MGEVVPKPDKWQTQQNFWSSFGLSAYDEQTAFTDGNPVTFPYLTYQSMSGVMGQAMTVTANLWYRSPSWAEISQKADDILRAIARGAVIALDNGYFWIKIPEATPFAQRVASGNDDIRRIMLTVEVECLTAN